MVWWCLIRERGHASDNQREQDEMLRLGAFRLGAFRLDRGAN